MECVVLDQSRCPVWIGHLAFERLSRLENEICHQGQIIIAQTVCAAPLFNLLIFFGETRETRISIFLVND